MQLSCPHCGFSKSVDRQRLPENAKQATCPRCRQSFALPEELSAVTAPDSGAEESTAIPAEPSSPYGTRAQVDALPKAGFWIRLVAALIDAGLVFILQFLLGSLLALAGAFSGAGSSGNWGSVALVIQLFTYALSFAYYIVFTGYCGQTPGKMALRIKVIRRNGQALGYPRAAFREVPAKFISGIIFGIGYLMIAFDDQKQGLHDRIVDSYVIKL